MPRFDSYPVIYWLLVYGLCWGVLWLTSWVRVSRRVFLIAAIGLLFLLRLPSIVYNYEINPDESQMITQALTLRHDPVYFQSVDGTTGGPLDSYFLILPSLIGLPFDYITAHLTAFCLLAISLWLLYGTASLWFGEDSARLALLPLVFVLGLTQNGDFLHYNSELVPLLLLSSSCYLYATLTFQNRPQTWRIALIGCLLGMVPFGKLQAVPMVGVIGLFVALLVVMSRGLTVSAKVSRLAALIVGGVSFPLLFVGLCWINGVYDDFVTFYLIGNLRYGSDTNQLLSILRLPAFFRKGDSFDWFIKLAVFIGVVGAILAWRRSKRVGTDLWKQIGFAVTLLLATLFAITRTGSEYVHYLFFLAGPLLFISAYGWQHIRQNFSNNRWVPIGIMGLFLVLFGAQAAYKRLNAIPLNLYSSEQQEGWTIQQSAVSKEIAKYAQPGEKLAVWGWRCDYYVQAQMPQGVAENHTIRSGFGHPMQPIYQKRYVSDFMRSSPPVFIDAVGSHNLWMNDRKTQGHELIKPLGQYVATHYRYVGLVDDTRIYVRNDRAKAGLRYPEKPLSKDISLLTEN
ncbi:hypothetical protein ACFSUS_17050 [Spirosoma soli]|uniref:Glycosyltransferase RgtA/B/C/D-like domain-containing protein n=1 Tax=Spirosoma soli TaxID=1770529 RepID=A0ABW5M5X9_9BACT